MNYEILLGQFHIRQRRPRPLSEKEPTLICPIDRIVIAETGSVRSAARSSDAASAGKYIYRVGQQRPRRRPNRILPGKPTRVFLWSKSVGPACHMRAHYVKRSCPMPRRSDRDRSSGDPAVASGGPSLNDVRKHLVSLTPHPFIRLS